MLFGTSESGDDAAVDNVRAQKRYLSEVMATGLSRLNMKLADDAATPTSLHGMDTDAASGASGGAMSPTMSECFSAYGTPGVHSRKRSVRHAAISGPAELQSPGGGEREGVFPGGSGDMRMAAAPACTTPVAEARFGQAAGLGLRSALDLGDKLPPSPSDPQLNLDLRKTALLRSLLLRTEEKAAPTPVGALRRRSRMSILEACEQEGEADLPPAGIPCSRVAPAHAAERLADLADQPVRMDFSAGVASDTSSSDDDEACPRMAQLREHPATSFLFIASSDFSITDEVEDEDGVRHCVALPGAAFIVEAKVQSGVHELPYELCARLLVDGRSPGYHNLLSAARPASRFEGWLMPTAEKGSRIRAFVFAKPQQVESALAPGGPPRASLAGTVTVEFKWKKFFMQPSLVAAAGAPVQHADAWTRGPPQFTKTMPVKTLSKITLRYELPSTLLARRLLDMTDPEHKALLDAEIPSLPVERERDGDAEAQAKRMKRERSSGAHKGPVIDLTPGPPPDLLLEVCCDLTEEAAEPAWSVRRKQPQEVS
ncbi:hypothetical protein WJX81_001313 [Elliptochloris bilobata]|uniref:Uncharacterized protein n=1 Tax=Elliptochloris bilobata TaxID=381761 RepID=A0AAW1QJT6_9CHLO